MNKPKWEDAPEWANYLAMDEDGYWYWHEAKPHKHIDNSNGSTWNSRGRIEETSFSLDWDKTLEERPK